MLGLMMQQPLLISQQIDFAAKFHASVEVVSRNTDGSIHRTTWGEIARMSKQLAQALTALGVGPGDRVATLAWNNHRHLALYFAVSGMGAVLHTINPRLPPDQLLYIVNHAEDRLFFFDATFAKLAQFLASQQTSIRSFIAMSGVPEGVAIANVQDFDALLKGHDGRFAWPALDENTASSLCYTSGTSGHPKGVLYSHRSTVLHSYAVCMADSLAISARDVTLPVVPMFHVNAWGVPYAAAMVGSKLVLPGPGLDGKNLYELIEREKVSSLLGVPTVWMKLLNHCKANQLTLSTVKKVTIGGSAVPPSMISAFEAHGARVLHAWGMTEMSPLGTANVLLSKHDALSPEQQLAVKAKQGRPIYGVDLRLLDDAGAEVPFDGKQSGHLQVRGPWIASSYFKSTSDDTHRDGWFFTGDIATIDSDAFMQITDRSKDVIKSGGEWISSIDIENAAMHHPGVAMAAVIGLPHAQWQERPLLIVVRAPNATVSDKELHEFLATKLIKWQLPDAIEFVEALPIGPTGKVLKRELRDKRAGRTLG